MSDDQTKMIYLKTDGILSTIESTNKRFQKKIDKTLEFIINWDEFKGKGLRAYEQINEWVQLAYVTLLDRQSLIGKYEDAATPVIKGLDKVTFKYNEEFDDNQHNCRIEGNNFIIELNFAKTKVQSPSVRDDLARGLVEV